MMMVATHSLPTTTTIILGVGTTMPGITLGTILGTPGTDHGTTVCM